MKNYLNKILKSKSIESFKSSSDFTTFQLFIARFENVSWKILTCLSDQIDQTRIATILSAILSTFYLLDSSNLSLINFLVRSLLAIVSLTIALASLKLRLVQSSLGYEMLLKVLSMMRIVSALVILSSLIFAPSIYTSIFARLVEIVCLVFLLASFINKSSDMYED